MKFTKCLLDYNMKQNSGLVMKSNIYDIYNIEINEFVIIDWIHWIYDIFNIKINKFVIIDWINWNIVYCFFNKTMFCKNRYDENENNILLQYFFISYLVDTCRVYMHHMKEIVSMIMHETCLIHVWEISCSLAYY